MGKERKKTYSLALKETFLEVSQYFILGCWSNSVTARLVNVKFRLRSVTVTK